MVLAESRAIPGVLLVQRMTPGSMPILPPHLTSHLTRHSPPHLTRHLPSHSTRHARRMHARRGVDSE